MKMRLSLRRGLVIQLSLCLGIVLLLAFIASVAPVGAQSDCVTQCSCQVNPDESTWKTAPETTCSAICRILWRGQMTTVYGIYQRTCTSKPIDLKCIPKTLCPNTQCETGQPTWDPDGCKGVAMSCTPWVQIGIKHGSCTSPD
jgi:hypothetical protein